MAPIADVDRPLEDQELLGAPFGQGGHPFRLERVEDPFQESAVEVVLPHLDRPDQVGTQVGGQEPDR